VLYLGSDVRFPQARIIRSGELPSLNDMLDRISKPVSGSQAGVGDLDPAHPFVGHDGLFYELEMAVPRQKVIVLHGLVGSGKTEATKAFARWWRDTSGVERPEWIFWYSFDPTTASGLDGVLIDIGQRIYGPEFARLSSEKRSAVMRETLDTHQMMLIWDNFQYVKSMADPTSEHGQLDEIGCRELRQFLTRLSGRQRGSSVLVMSRTSETWLGDVRGIRLEGLRPDEAAEYARDLLAPYPAAAPRRDSRLFGDLMDVLSGNPLCMSAILPCLNTADPETLLEQVRGDVPLQSEDDADNSRIASLFDTIGSSFTCLSAETRALLLPVSLFQGAVDVMALTSFSQASTSQPGSVACRNGSGLRLWRALLRWVCFHA
jgi:hypothetical protein